MHCTHYTLTPYKGPDRTSWLVLAVVLAMLIGTVLAVVVCFAGKSYTLYYTHYTVLILDRILINLTFTRTLVLGA